MFWGGVRIFLVWQAGLIIFQDLLLDSVTIYLREKSSGNVERVELAQYGVESP